jgi:hypothetical protein
MNTNAGKFGYEIRVSGHLDPYWCAWFENWTITNLESGEALLKSTKVDLPGVYSALNKIRDLNLALISVIRIPSEVDGS